MRLNWILCAAVTACTAVPALAQTDGTVVVTTTTRTSAGPMEVTNVDMSEVRDYMDDLRDYLTRIQENNRLAWSTADIVHMDAYRRRNAGLLDNASALAMNLSNELGPAARIPGGLGASRDYVDMVKNHLHHARMMADYSTPIDQAKIALENAYEAMDRSNVAMSGSTMSPTSTTTTVTTETDTSGTTENTGTDMDRTTEPGMD